VERGIICGFPEWSGDMYASFNGRNVGNHD
jgi:hypothetical protein